MMGATQGVQYAQYTKQGPRYRVNQHVRLKQRLTQTYRVSAVHRLENMFLYTLAEIQGAHFEEWTLTEIIDRLEAA